MLVIVLATGLILTTIYLTNQYFKLLKSAYHFGIEKIHCKRNSPKVEFIPLH